MRLLKTEVGINVAWSPEVNNKVEEGQTCLKDITDIKSRIQVPEMNKEGIQLSLMVFSTNDENMFIKLMYTLKLFANNPKVHS